MSDLQDRLNSMALSKTHPFCYQCYTRAPSGKCSKCGSDDLMRELPGVGVEYGTDWVIKSILESELTPVDVEEVLAESIRESYGETAKVGWLEVDTVETLKEHTVDWRCALADEESRLMDDEQVYSPDNGSTLYWMHEVESLLDKAESEAS